MACKPHPDALQIARSCIALRTRRLDRIVTKLYDEALRPYGLRSTQLSLLVGIEAHGKVPPTTLGRHLEMEKSTVSRNIARLIEHGWVNSQESTEERGHMLSLTASGRKILADAHAGWKKAQAQVREVIGAELVDVLSETKII